LNKDLFNILFKNSRVILKERGDFLIIDLGDTKINIEYKLFESKHNRKE